MPRGDLSAASEPVLGVQQPESSERADGKPDRMPPSLAGAARRNLDLVHRETHAAEPLDKDLIWRGGPNCQHTGGAESGMRRLEAGPRVQPVVLSSRQTFGAVIDIQQYGVVGLARRTQDPGDVHLLDGDPPVL